MLQLNKINNQYIGNLEASNEINLLQIIGIIVAVQIIGTIISNIKQGKKDEETAKYLPALIKNYSKICDYINTNLKDDEFFFTKKQWNLYNIDFVFSCVKEHIEKIPKLMHIPQPQSNDTAKSYEAKIKAYFGNKEYHMNNDWEKVPDRGVLSENGWLNGSKMSELFKLIAKNNEAEDDLFELYDELYREELSDGTEAGECIWSYVGGEFYSDNNPDVASRFEEQFVDFYDTLFDITRHLQSYLKSKYGSDPAVRSALNKLKNH